MRALLAAALLASLVQAMRAWLPLDREENGTPRFSPHRVDLARAILAATDDPHEMLLLARIARFESHYRPDVASCAVRGPQGELGAWQVLPRSPAEARELCASLEGSARVALSRVRESLKACAHVRPEWRLGLYVRGRCTGAEAHRLSEHRWVSP